MRMTPTAVGVAGALALVALTGVACSGGSSTTSSSASSASSSSSSSAVTTSASAAKVDYTTLPIRAEDIVIPGETFTASAPQLNPGGADGIAVAFNNATASRSIGDSIVILADADADAAKKSLDGAVAALDQSITDPSPQPAEVGSNGMMATGVSPDGTKAVTVVTFTEGAAFVLMEFDSAASDPVPPDFAISLAQKQDANVKGALG
jgi:hypothetical protein